MKSCVEISLKHCIDLPNDNFLEQEYENFNQKEVGSEELLGNDNNGEEEEYQSLSYKDFNHNLLVNNFFLGLIGKYN